MLPHYGCQGSSVVEQETHKLLVGSSNLPLGTSLRCERSEKRRLSRRIPQSGRSRTSIQQSNSSSLRLQSFERLTPIFGKAQEYAGGYYDYLRQRKSDEADKTAAKSTKTTRPKNGAPKKQGKLSYKDQRELDSLPASIAKLEGTISAFSEKLAQADFYTRDPKGFEEATNQLARQEAELARAEERWLELEELKESLGQG